MSTTALTPVKKSTLDFLRRLKKHNNRPWFEKNRSAYEAAKENVEAFTASLIDVLSASDRDLKGLAPKDCLFRIYRDVRFSKNKAPYKTAFGAVIAPGGRKSDRAGFYIHVEPGSCFTAGGRWMPSPEHLRDIRKEILYNTTAFKRILNAAAFKKRFGELYDSKLKLAPKGFDKDFNDIELLKYTSYIAECNVPDGVMVSRAVFRRCADTFRDMKPLLKFLNGATH
jgi:uncharacterized protein (TIGR02453 family)